MAGMIVAPQPLAVEAGAQVLRGGGNAVDAAVTCALVQGVVSPQMRGIGGYALLQMQRADGSAIALDAPATAGAKVWPEMWEDALIRPNPEGWGFFLRDKVNDLGYSSAHARRRQGPPPSCSGGGTISWAEAVEPAAGLAEAGFAVDAVLAAGWRARASQPEASRC